MNIFQSAFKFVVLSSFAAILIGCDRKELWRTGESSGGIFGAFAPDHGVPFFETKGVRYFGLQGAPPYYVTSNDGNWRCFASLDHGRIGRKDNKSWIHLVSSNLVWSIPLESNRFFGPPLPHDRRTFTLTILTNKTARIEDLNEFNHKTTDVDLENGRLISKKWIVIKRP